MCNSNYWVEPHHGGLAAEEEYPWRVYEHRMQRFIMNTAAKVDAANLQNSPNQELASRIYTVWPSLTLCTRLKTVSRTHIRKLTSQYKHVA